MMYDTKMIGKGVAPGQKLQTALSGLN